MASVGISYIEVLSHVPNVSMDKPHSALVVISKSSYRGRHNLRKSTYEPFNHLIL